MPTLGSLAFDDFMQIYLLWYDPFIPWFIHSFEAFNVKAAGLFESRKFFLPSQISRWCSFVRFNCSRNFLLWAYSYVSSLRCNLRKLEGRHWYIYIERLRLKLGGFKNYRTVSRYSICFSCGVCRRMCSNSNPRVCSVRSVKNGGYSLAVIHGTFTKRLTTYRNILFILQDDTASNQRTE